MFSPRSPVACHLYQRHPALFLPSLTLPFAPLSLSVFPLPLLHLSLPYLLLLLFATYFYYLLTTLPFSLPQLLHFSLSRPVCYSHIHSTSWHSDSSLTTTSSITISSSHSPILSTRLLHLTCYTCQYTEVNHWLFSFSFALCLVTYFLVAVPQPTESCIPSSSNPSLPSHHLRTYTLSFIQLNLSCL